MKLQTKRYLAVLLLGGFVLSWRANTDLDVAVAQGRKPILITRIFNGKDGLAYAEDVELKLNARGVSDMLKATGAEFSVRPPTAEATPRGTDWKASLTGDAYWRSV